MLINILKDLLTKALNSSDKERQNNIKQFQNIVWNDTSIKDELLNDLLTDIAYLLDFYEPNEELRKEDPSYYDDNRLEEEVKLAIQKLHKQTPI